MKYGVIERLSRAEIESAIKQGDPEELSHAVLSAAIYSDDPAWAEGVCLRLAKRSNFNVRGNAILGFGHIARVHGKLNEEAVKPLIEAALRDENDYVKGQAEAASGDVEFFLKWEINRPL